MTEFTAPNTMRDASDEAFRQTWRGPTGFARWFSAVNNQPIGKRFMVTALAFFMIGGVMALLMRIQLAVPENDFLGPQVFNQLFTMHGSTMMYLFSVPFFEGLALYMLPLMLGSRDVAFPRLSAFGYWTYLFGGLMFYAGFIFGPVADAGWFAYPPLSTSHYSDKGMDFWLMGLGLVEIAGIAAGVEIVVTILKFRAPGMTLSRMPLFVWAMLVAGIMIIFAFTTLLTASLMLELDRTLQTRFFSTGHGGSTLLWQHLFWFFGHPEVYIIFIPATGIISAVVGTFARRFVGYSLVVVAIIITGFVSFGLWVHHMYATGLPQLAMNFFAAASLMIAVASGTQIFAWIASLWGTRPALRAPMLYMLGFVIIFVAGGLTGVMIAIVPFDWQVHDTYFIVAHFHYVLIGGAVFPVFAGLHYWVPKITGRMLSEALGKWSFGLAFIGFNVTFFPMHLMGFWGMPRRVYTYPELMGIGGHNLLATAGAFVFGLGLALFLINFIWSLRKGPPAGDNPWGGDSLEWSISSPPPGYSFLRPPAVYGRHPQWMSPESIRHNAAAERATAAMHAAPHDWRATLCTSVLDAQPQAIQYLPGPNYMPLFAALGLLLAAIGVLVETYLLVPLGLVFTAGALAVWLRPDRDELRRRQQSDLMLVSGLPLFATGTRSSAWWGMLCLIAILSTAFVALFYSYFYIWLFSDAWPQGNLAAPRLPLALIAFGLLLAGAAPHYLAARCHPVRDKVRMQVYLVIGLVLAVGFVVAQGLELLRVGFLPRENAYASLFFVIHLLLTLVAVGAGGMNIAMQLRLWQQYDGREPLMALELQMTEMFWYFTAAAGAVVFVVLYLAPYVL